MFASITALLWKDKLVRKEGAFIWLKYYVMLMMCNLKQQLNFEYFKHNLTISILGL